MPKDLYSWLCPLVCLWLVMQTFVKQKTKNKKKWIKIKIKNKQKKLLNHHCTSNCMMSCCKTWSLKCEQHQLINPFTYQSYYMYYMIYDKWMNGWMNEWMNHSIIQSIIQQTVSRCNQTIYQRRITWKCQDLVIFGHFGSFRASGWGHQRFLVFSFILI